MSANVVIVNAFDAYAGSQRMAYLVSAILDEKKVPFKIVLGFGRSGFLSAGRGAAAFCASENRWIRILLYPVWVVVANIVNLRAAVNGSRFWVNTVYSVPAILLCVLFRPSLIIVHVHEIEAPWLLRSLTYWVQRRGARLICVSNFHRNVTGLVADVLPNAVTASDGVHNLRNRLIYVGSARRGKGFELFIDVAAELVGSGIESWAYLPSVDAVPMRLQRVAEMNGVTVVTGVTDSNELYRDGFLTFIPSDPRIVTETFSLVCAESIACGVPVCGAGSIVMEEVGGNALAFNDQTRSAKIISDKILKLWSDPARYETLVVNCRERRSNFSLQAFSKKLQEILSGA